MTTKIDHRRQEVQQIVKNACDQLNQEGVDARNYVEQLAWLFFLKAFDEAEARREQEAVFDDKGFERRLAGDYAWSSWAKDTDHPDQMLEFVSGKLWTKLTSPDPKKGLGNDPMAQRFRRIFENVRNYCGRTLHADGTLNHASCWGRPTLWSTLCYAFGLSVLGRYHVLFDPETMRTWKRDSVREVDIISGCLLLIPRTLWDALGGFDPAFDMYAEDFDLCLRARDMGVRCVLCPEGEIIHYGSASECVKADQLVRQMKAKTRLMRKHWGRLSSALGGVLLRMRVATRGYVGVIPFAANERRTGAAQAWREAWRRRREWLEL